MGVESAGRTGSVACEEHMRFAWLGLENQAEGQIRHDIPVEKS